MEEEKGKRRTKLKVMNTDYSESEHEDDNQLPEPVPENYLYTKFSRDQNT